MSVTISRCSPGDVDDVVQFIDAHWKRGHALVMSRALLDWQYRNPEGAYSFAVARRSGEVVGLLGYISTRRYDAALAGANVIWLTTWKVRDDANVAALGLSLLRHVADAEPHSAIGAIGFNPSTRPLYTALGFRVGELQHFAASRGASTAAAPLSATDVTETAAFDALDIATRGGIVPRKTPRYFYARYAAHPFYDYRVVALRDAGVVVGLLAARVAEHDGRRALRIVDFVGSPGALARSGSVVQSLIREHDAQYADIYNAGIDESAFACAGFRRVDPEGTDIVPDHFEPFEPRNIRLWFAIRTADDPVLFKGDADQDRPNRIVESGR